MHVLTIILVSLLSISTHASVSLTTQIHDIDYGSQSGDETLVLLKNGLVAKIKPTGQKNLSLDLLDYKDKWFKFKIDKNRYIQGFTETISPSSAIDENLGLKSFQNYVPTTVASMEVAKKYFNESPRNSKESQCFNRAMVWSYEWWKNHSTKSMKLFIFFSRKYIRAYNFEWWFHIAPYLHIMDNGKVVERAMDVKYSSRPLSFRDWSNIFMKNDAECKFVTKYSDYADYPFTGECYFMRANMYTYQPADLEMNEAWNYTKTNWVGKEVRDAYLEAFDRTLP